MPTCALFSFKVISDSGTSGLPIKHAWHANEMRIYNEPVLTYASDEFRETNHVVFCCTETRVEC